MPQLSARGRTVAASARRQALVRASRLAAWPDEPQSRARAGKPSPEDQATATAFYGQPAFTDSAGDDNWVRVG